MSLTKGLNPRLLVTRAKNLILIYQFCREFNLKKKGKHVMKVTSFIIGLTLINHKLNGKFSGKQGKHHQH